MTYFTFHLVFIFPPILVLAWLLWQRREGISSQLAPIALTFIAAVAFIYTTPWDNYLVWRGIWEYGQDRVLGTIGYVPIEEYLFFLLQPILTGLWLYWLLVNRGESPQPESPPQFRVLIFALGVALSIAGFLMLRSHSTLYLGLILAWAIPIVSLQWLIGAATLWAMKRMLLVAVVVPTLYLWIADRIAIANGIWQISDAYTTGLKLFGLPVEEATFFLVTNLLVVQGIALFLSLKVTNNLVKLVDSNQ